MHFQSTYSGSPYISGGVMVDNSVATWPLVSTAGAPQQVIDTSAVAAPTTQWVYSQPEACAPLSHPPLYSSSFGDESSASPAPSAPYYPDVQSVSSSSLSPAPSSPSICGSITTDSPAPSSSSSQLPDVALRNIVEQRSAAVANMSNPVRAEVEPSYEEQMKNIKPLLRKPIDTSKMSSDQVQRLNRRRQRNKQAAERCRIKRREKSGHIRQELTLLTRSNEELEQELIRLRTEMQNLQQMLCSHQCQIGHSKEDLVAMVSDMAAS